MFFLHRGIHEVVIPNSYFANDLYDACYFSAYLRIKCHSNAALHLLAIANAASTGIMKGKSRLNSHSNKIYYTSSKKNIQFLLE